MSDPIAIYGVVLGAAGCVASGVSAVYFRSQARAAHRKNGVVTDQYWHVWTRTFFRFYAAMPTFLRVFDFASKEGLLHQEFVTFYRGAIDGEPLAHPAGLQHA